MKRRHQVGYSILALVAVAFFGLRPLAPTSAATPADLAKPVAPPAGSKAPLVKAYGKLPLAFEANKGQMDERVKFLAHGSGYTLFLTGDEAVLTLRSASQKAKGKRQRSKVEEPAAEIGNSKLEIGASKFAALQPSLATATHAGLQTPDSGPQTQDSVLRMKLVGVNANAWMTGNIKLPGKSNYFIGNDPKKWRTNVPTYAKVRYNGVYPGVDLVYYGNQGGQLEYDFVVAPGADPGVIKLDVGAVREPPTVAAVGTPPLQKRAHRDAPLQIAPDGDLVVKTEGGDICFQKPIVYQQDGEGRKQYVYGRYLLQAAPSASENPESRISFAVAAYDHSKPLVIDPAIAYSTFLGGTTNSSVATAIATYTDSSTGHVYAYAAGSTCASDFPNVNAEQTVYGGGCISWGYGNGDAFVTKFDPSASGAASVIYSTFLGGSGVDNAFGIAVDSAGNAYITGSTGSTDFPLVGAYQTGLKSGPQLLFSGGYRPQNAYLAKLSPEGSALLYSTYFGGTGGPYGGDSANAIALDSVGRAYIAGPTQSTDLPTVNPYQRTGGGFLAAFDTTLSGSNSLVYSTYTPIIPQAIAVDGAGGVHLGGGTGVAFPIVNGFQASPIGGGGAAIYAKLNPSASGSAQLVYSTYLGGGGDTVQAIAVDSAGNAYLSGSTNSQVWPTTPGALQTTPPALGNYPSPFIAKIVPSQAGSASLVYSTLLSGPGSNGSGNGSGIAVDASGDAFVVGTLGPGMPLVNPVQGSPNGVFQSINAGQSWAGLTQGLTDFPMTALAVDVSTSPRTLYAGTESGAIFSTTDGGLNWNKVFQAPGQSSGYCPVSVGGPLTCVMALAVDPNNPSNVYAGTSTGLYKSSDRGATWSPFNTGLGSLAVQQGVMALTFDGGTLYAGEGDGLYKLSTGASSWTSTTLAVNVQNIAFDPSTAPHTIYTSSTGSGVYKSTDGGATWVAGGGGAGGNISGIAVDTATTPSTLYGYDNGFPGVDKSVDGGSTWNLIGAAQGFFNGFPTIPLYVDTTTTPSTLYIAEPESGIFKSTDGGNSGTNILGAGMSAMAVDATTANGTAPITLYAGTGPEPTTNAFVAELNPTGSAILFSTYLGGIGSHASGNAIALDAPDNIYVTGQVANEGADQNPISFPTVNAFQTMAAENNGQAAAFFTMLGSQILPTNSSGSVTTQVAVQTGTLAITFPSITGSTTSGPPTLTVTPLSSTTTANLSLSNNLGAYDISTTASFSGTVTLCFQANTVNDAGTFSDLQILHIVNGSPVNVTSSYNFSTRTICGAVTSFSPFVMVKGADGQLKDLVHFVNESNINHGIQNSLDAKLQNALSAWDSAHKNNYSTVCNMMGAFMNSVGAQEGKAITMGEAKAFTSAAKQIDATLGCSP